jgi:hypothetical protein
MEELSYIYITYRYSCSPVPLAMMDMGMDMEGKSETGREISGDQRWTTMIEAAHCTIQCYTEHIISSCTIGYYPSSLRYYLLFTSFTESHQPS